MDLRSPLLTYEKTLDAKLFAGYIESPRAREKTPRESVRVVFRVSQRKVTSMKKLQTTLPPEASRWVNLTGVPVELIPTKEGFDKVFLPAGPEVRADKPEEFFGSIDGIEVFEYGLPGILRGWPGNVNDPETEDALYIVTKDVARYANQIPANLCRRVFYPDAFVTVGGVVRVYRLTLIF